MNLGIIADVHGNHLALAAVLAEFRKRNIERLLFLGDMFGYFPFVNESVAMLGDFNVTSVRGNHDQIALECLRSGSLPAEAYDAKYGTALRRSLQNLSTQAEAFLLALPERMRLEVEGTHISMQHGAPWDALNGRVYPDCKDLSPFDDLPEEVCLMAHTHYQCLWRRKALVVNPGSVGQPRDHRGHLACAAVLSAKRNEAELIAVPYDAMQVLDDCMVHNEGLQYITHRLRAECHE